ncbi:hypothetical protein K501DRAFT_166383 [Backusella circina FSU 941]|nr:hypothetical protein K501DRAFT_166383 [Backusella circina FSU 941]
MYFWLQRCSICLDQTYSLCLENCRDQFCKDCFARYIEVTVNQSWGLGVSRIKCPVCQETISQSEWSRYVSPEIVDKYNRFNHPYRPFSRHCHGCESPIAPCQSPRAQGISRESRLERIASYLDQFSQATHHLPHKQMMDTILDLFLKTCQTTSTFRVGKVQELYHQIMPSVLKVVKRQSDMYDQASTISKHLVALEMIPETWKQIQFWHISNFPTEACAHCHDKICLQCGEVAHVNLSCLDNLRLKLKKEKPESEWASTIQWKLNHTYGCNRVDCLLCGHTFCWRCGSGWSQTELGVPDMHAIDARRQVANL